MTLLHICVRYYRISGKLNNHQKTGKQASLSTAGTGRVLHFSLYQTKYSAVRCSIGFLRLWTRIPEMNRLASGRGHHVQIISLFSDKSLSSPQNRTTTLTSYMLTLRKLLTLEILRGYGLPEKIVNIVRMLYQDSLCRVACGQHLTDSFRVQTGVKKGCMLSPLPLGRHAALVRSHMSG